MLFLPFRMMQQALATPSLPRIPEPEPIMVGKARCTTYASATQSQNLQAVFEICLDVISACGISQGRALDLGCGTGQLLRMLAGTFPTLELMGLDASPDMLQLCQQLLQGDLLAQRLTLQQGDLRSLNNLPSQHFQLTTWTMTAHHLDALEEVAQVLEALERITHPDGMILVLDLGRLKTRTLNDWYIGWAGRAYDPALLEEFRISMNAAFSADELKTLLQRPSLRRFEQITPFGLPTLQLLVRVPQRPERSSVRSLSPRPSQQRRTVQQSPSVAQDYKDP